MVENTGVSAYRKRTQKDYSLAFKMQVVDEIEKGALNQDQAQRKYGIQGNATILTWLRKHGTLDWHRPQPMPGKEVPHKKIRELERRIKRLEAEKYILNTAIDVADELFHTDIRKKYLPLVQQNSASSKGQTQADTESLEEPQP